MDAKQHDRLKKVGKCGLSAYGIPVSVRNDIDELRRLEGKGRSRNAYLKDCIMEIVRIRKEQYKQAK